VDEGLGVDVFDAGDELIGEEKNRLQGELAVAEVEQVLETGTQEVDNHGVVVALSTEPADEGDTDTTGEGLVDASLIFELRVLGLDALKLDGDLFTRNDVGAYVIVSSRTKMDSVNSPTEVDITERTASDLTADAVLVTDTQILCMMSANRGSRIP
jgi:hypothetical protein